MDIRLFAALTKGLNIDEVLSIIGGNDSKIHEMNKELERLKAQQTILIEYRDKYQELKRGK